MLADVGRGRGPQRFILVLGRSGWGPGQLERELRQRAWFVIPFDAQLVFGKNQAGKWRTALKRKAVDL